MFQPMTVHEHLCNGNEMIMSHDETNFIPTKIEDIPRATQNFKILKSEKRTTEEIC